MLDLPTGIVTFLFTDIEGSTKLLRRLGDRYGGVIRQHHRILRQAIEHGRGVEVGTEGDAFFAVFISAAGAVGAAVHAQRSLAAAEWPDGRAVRVRMGMHTGRAVLVGEEYMGMDIHLAARIGAAAHGGQVLVSEVIRNLIEPDLPDGVSLRDLGRHRLKDIEQPIHLWDLVVRGLPSEFPAIRSLDARPTNLPPQRTSFVGREREVQAVAGLLDDAVLVTLTGPGGTGKTRLAIKVASALLDRFADGVFFADLSAITDAALVPSVIAGAMVVREEPGRDLLDTLADHLRDRHVLLVVDNSEQVIESGATVARLLDAAPRLTILATSRVPFHISGEREFPVPPLAVPGEASNLEALARSEAVGLFVQRAAAVRPGFRLAEDNASTVADITRRLDGLPLAIELATSRLSVLSPQALLERLGGRLDLLSQGPRDLPARHRTLRATIEWSHDLLHPEEQRLLARLGVFSGGWTFEAADAICGPGLGIDVLDGLATLVDQSLVRRTDEVDGTVRFSMFETIREFAVERLASGPEEGELRSRHLRSMRELAERARSELRGEGQFEWLERLEREHDNLRAAIEWSLEGGDLRDGLRTAAAVWRFWQQRGHLREARMRLGALLSSQEARAPDAVRASALGALGSIAYWQNDKDAMRGAYQEALAIARQVGDANLRAEALLNASFVPTLDGHFDEAETVVRAGLNGVDDTVDPEFRAELWTALGFIQLWRGDPAGAIEPLQTAIGIIRPTKNRLLLADHLVGLGAVTRMLGDSPQAKAHFREALETFAAAGSTVNIPMALTGLAITANDEGRHERAGRLLGAAARLRDESGGGAPPELIGRIGDPEADARAAAGDEAFERALADGRAMGTEDAVAYGLERHRPERD